MSQAGDRTLGVPPTTPSSSPVDVCFTVKGTSIPLDHGYALLGAIARRVPAIHERTTWGVHAIPGRRRAPGRLELDGRSMLRLRLPARDIAETLPLIGAALDLAGEQLEVGSMRVSPLVPAARLWARVVTIKGFMDEAGLRDAVRRQLAALPALGQDPERIELDVGGRRVIRIKDQSVVGFRVRLAGLDSEASLVVQTHGIGGRRHMGAGLFIPDRS